MESTQKEFEQLIASGLSSRNNMLEVLAAAFIGQTKLLPSECELVQETKPNEIVWYYRKRENLTKQ